MQVDDFLCLSKGNKRERLHKNETDRDFVLLQEEQTLHTRIFLLSTVTMRGNHPSISFLILTRQTPNIRPNPISMSFPSSPLIHALSQLMLCVVRVLFTLLSLSSKLRQSHSKGRGIELGILDTLMCKKRLGREG